MINHNQIEININGNLTKVDEKIAPLIEMMNKYGIITKGSCQSNIGDWRDGEAYIGLDPKQIELYCINGEIIGRLIFKIPDELLK